MLTAFDPINAELQQSSWRLGQRDETAMVELTARLVNYYQGNQAGYLDRYLSALFTDKDLRERYRMLAAFYNVTRLLVDRTTTMGRAPIQVSWQNKADADIWEKLAYGDNDLDLFIQSIAKYTTLAKTVVAGAFWEKDRETISLKFYTRNVMEIEYATGNRDFLHPDIYRVLIDEAAAGGEEWNVWDYSDPKNGLTYDAVGSQGRMNQKAEGVPAGPLVNGRTLVPFIPFRTAYAWDRYFIDDGQLELVEGQERVNRLLTQLNVLMHYAAFPVPVGTGPAWATKNGRTPKVPLDPSQIMVIPNVGIDGNGSDFKWVSPGSEQMITRHIESIREVVDQLAASFHMSPAAFRVQYTDASGVALWIQSAALIEKQREMRTLFQKPLETLVGNIREIWNYYSAADAPKFSDGHFTLSIPDVSFALDPQTELDIDLKKLEVGAMEPEDFVKKHNPGVDPAKLSRLIARMQTRLDDMAPKAANPLPRAGLFKRATGGSSVAGSNVSQSAA